MLAKIVFEVAVERTDRQSINVDALALGAVHTRRLDGQCLHQGVEDQLAGPASGR
ncbi:hypothetical protein [Solirubrobacter soli]|uniref:hypothetical protein n=1 Tax=Solirubrobacter soli TaxID=363832 RepID=UPI00042770A9|nr:hypothetical protein [Solirubrobacter soli]